jgi:hypothetical protein
MAGSYLSTRSRSFVTRTGARKQVQQNQTRTLSAQETEGKVDSLMIQFVFDLHKPLEQNIQSYLTAVRESNPAEYRVTMFMLLTCLNAAKTAAWTIYRSKPLGRMAGSDPGIPVAVFNKTVGDMKRAGIIGTCKGGEEVFLSNAAWDLYTKEHATKTTNPFVALASSTTTSTEVSK